MAQQIQLRRDTSTNWTTNNPVLAQGEVGIETNTNRFKIGNGTNTWSALSYSATTDHTLLSNIGTNTHTQIDSHIASSSNPHSVTKTQVGLSDVDNTSDANKPISTATQTALNAKISSDPTGVSGADQITNAMSLTTAEYTAIGSPNASTLYVITDAT